MSWQVLVIFIISTSVGSCINRPVYKIVLAQKGYAQFVQYDVETPPLREFTFCTWIRVYDIHGDQTIFTYVANGNNRVVRLWLDSGGQQMKISINGRITSSTPVDIVKDVWRHVCLSYQADFGVWALYIDARLVSCEAAQSLYGYVLPGGGSVIIGYGTADNGAPNGFEGEIFGANMILTSTIERNFTAKSDPLYEQKRFQRNKLKDRNKNFQYIVLSDLQTDEIHNNFENIQLPDIPNRNRSYIKFNTPHSSIDHDVGKKITTSSVFDSSSIEREILRFTTNDKGKSTENDKLNFWNILNGNENGSKYKTQTKTGTTKNEYFTSLPEFETPPPPGPPNQVYAEENIKEALKTNKPPIHKPFQKVNKDQVPTKNLVGKNTPQEIFDLETPPPDEKNTKVYGQWTSSKFAGNVLNYLKTINFSNREQRKIPPTIQLSKLSDSYPYASEFRMNKLRPSNQFQRRSFMEKRIETVKKDPQINVQILEDDLRSNIIKSHSLTKPKNVEITNRGDLKKKQKDRRFYRNVDSQESEENMEEDIYNLNIPKPFTAKPIKRKPSLSDLSLQNKNLMAILPFLKSLEYFIEDSQNSESNTDVKQDMYTKSLSSPNKWHNVKSYSNDYTPRKITLDPNNGQDAIDKTAEAAKRHPAVRLKYKHEERKLVQSNGQEENMLKGRELAMEVSNQSNHNKNSVSILKYNHGFLPGHDNKLKVPNKQSPVIQGNVKLSKIHQNNFNRHVKIGNALNERDVIGESIEQKKQRFVGDETIPDINKYSSNIDHIRSTVPPSIGPRVCKNVELYDRVLYVQPDESIDMTHILSPVRAKNIGMEFILQNYKKCSLTESSLENNAMLFIDWSKTPVRLFGGAYPKTTTDLCGFF